MTRKQRLTVVKRDGSLEPFDLAKLARCLANVMRACSYEERLADPLAEAVALHLRQRPVRELPTSGYVFHCVQTVLSQTGLGEAAERLASHHHARQRAAAAAQALPAAGARPGTGPVLRAELATRLRDEYGLLPVVAAHLGLEVEQHVLRMGYREITPALLHELLRSELAAWGLTNEAFRVRAERRSSARGMRTGEETE